MERVMEKSWNFNHLFSEKNSGAAKINKTDGKSVFNNLIRHTEI